MKKNIVLIDTMGNYIASALATEKYNIKLLILNDINQVNECRDLYKDLIERYYYRCPVTNAEYNKLNETDYNLTYDDIEKFRSTQLKTEHFLHRELGDDASIQDRYYTALRFFLGFFESNKIDMVFSAQFEHGAIWDSLIIDIAKSKNIPVFIVSPASSNCIVNINNLMKIHNGETVICDVSKISGSRDYDKYQKDLESYISKMKNNPVKDNKQESRDTLLNKIKYRIKYLIQVAYETTHKFLREYRTNYDVFFHQSSFYQKEFTEKEIYIKNLKKFYDQLSTKPNYNENYIFYPLHQEPEATIMVRTTMSCQLHIVKLLAENLPEGWKLYVKEHPSEFYVYKKVAYFYKNIDYFRSQEFYKRIKKIKNVRLISFDYSTNDLIEHSKAVTSITGSVFAEAIKANKPIIVWGHLSTYIEKLKSAFCVTSIETLKNSIDKISKGFTPDYSDFQEVLNKYTYFANAYGTILTYKENTTYKEVFELIYDL